LIPVRDQLRQPGLGEEREIMAYSAEKARVVFALKADYTGARRLVKDPEAD
jgi:hypothetical protein